MATLQGMNIWPINSNGYRQYKNFYSFRTTSSSGGYVHMKLNVPNDDYTMWMVEAVGYAYGNGGRPIRTAWVWYNYPPAGGTSYIGLHTTAYEGGSAHGVYNSSDGYAVLRYSGGLYFTGFILNAYETRGNANYKIAVTEVAQNSTSGAHF